MASDDAVIEAAIHARAAVLITRDEDIYRASEVLAWLAAHGVEVMGLRRFLESVG